MTIAAIHISSARMTVVGEKELPKAFSALKNNQIVQARVLQVTPPDQARLLINGQKINVKTSVPLHSGENIHLKVQAQKDGYVLRLTSPSSSGTPKLPASLLRFFSRPDTLSTLFKTDQPLVLDILEKMALKSSRRDEQFLPRLMDKGGLLLEKKLAAVLQQQDPASANRQTGRQLPDKQAQQVPLPDKPQVPLSDKQQVPLPDKQLPAKLLHRLVAEDFKGAVLKQALSPGMGTDAKSSGAAALVQTLENLQLLNNQSAESGRYLLPFPVLADAGFTLGQLLVDTGEDKDTAPEKKMIRVSLLLDMTYLGPVRADVSILDKAVTGRFLLENEDTRAFVASMIPVLKKQLADNDFQLMKMDCQVAAPADIAPDCLTNTLFNRRDDQVLHIVI